MNNVVCQYCQQTLQYPNFNFCSHCGKRIIDSRNTNDVEELTQREVDEDKEFLSSVKILDCKRCRFPVFFEDVDNFCCMCGYPINNPKFNFLENEIGIENVDINLGRYNYYLDSGEVCLFHQDDVAWYCYTTNYRDQMYMSTSARFGNVTLTSLSRITDNEPDSIWNVRAAGTLYLTNKKVILYDRGFSNIWTKLSIEGDFPEQVMGFDLENIFNIVGPINVGHRLKGFMLKTSYGEAIIAPSSRKYRGRKTSMMDEYSSLQNFSDKLFKLINHR